eukprot:1746553-Karenia_brevis.AAC.1
MILGKIDCGGIGLSKDSTEAKDSDSLRAGRGQQNEAILASQRDDKHADWLVQQMQEESTLGRMTPPLEIHDSEAYGWLLQPRFCVEQAKPDGSFRKRPIDHFSFSVGGAVCMYQAESVNGYAEPVEFLKHDTLDNLAQTLRVFKNLLQEVPGLLKADIDNAFRRIPIFPGHRWACGVAVKRGRRLYASQHIACPLGAVASVVAWERIGAALTHLGR